MSQDILGREMTAEEEEILKVYESLKSLAGRDDLAPCAASNIRFATAALAQVVTDLGLSWEHLHHIRI